MSLIPKPWIGIIAVFLVASLVIIPTISGQTVRIPAKYEYAVKFVCGQGDDKQVVKGFYLTAINVHNPGTKPSESITFAKKVVHTLPNEKSGPVSIFKKVTLEPNRGFEIDCADIKSFITPPTSAFSTGFVIIMSPKLLDVTAVYTVRGNNGEVASIDVEVIVPKSVDVVITP